MTTGTLSLKIISLPFFFSAVCILALGLLAFFKGQRKKAQAPFLFFCLATAGWMFFSMVSEHNQPGMLWNELIFTCMTAAALALFYFYDSASKLKSRAWARHVLMQAALALVASEFLFGLWMPRALENGWDRLSLAFFSILVLSLNGFKLYRKIQSERHNSSRLELNKTCYLLLTNIFVMASFAFYWTPDRFLLYPVETVCMLCAAFVAYYSTLHLQTMPDIGILARKSLTAAFKLATLALIILISSAVYLLIEPQSAPLKIALIAALSAAAAFVLTRFYSPVNDCFLRQFFPHYYEKEQHLERLSHHVVQSNDRAQLNSYLKEAFLSIFKCTGASFYLWDQEKCAYILQGHCGGRPAPVMQMESNYILPKFLAQKNYLLIHDNLCINGETLTQENQDLLSVVCQNHINLCVPIVSGNIHFSADPGHTSLPQENERDKYLVGFFIFAEKASHLAYNLDEVRHLQHLAQCVDIALQSMQLDQAQNAPEGFQEPQEDHPKLRHYFPPSIADEVLSRVQSAERWNGQKHHAVILMFDLRGFTSMFEANKAEEVVEWLNEYFKEMIETITNFGGTIDKFMGDGGLVVFGVSRMLVQPEYDAVQCALEMQKSLKKLNAKRKQKGLKLLHMGIAITAGDVMAGNIGSEKHMEYTVIGDPVNLASRLQAMAKSGQIIATESIKEKIAESILFKECPAIEVRGKTEKVKIIEIQHEKARQLPPSGAEHPNPKAMGY